MASTAALLSSPGRCCCSGIRCCPDGVDSTPSLTRWTLDRVGLNFGFQAKKNFIKLKFLNIPRTCVAL